MGEKQLKKILNEILNHEDYGKRNPIDIGSELGYSPNDILEAMNMPQMEQNEEEKKEYLLLGSGQVVVFDLLKRKVFVVKKLDENVDAKIKNGILIWTNAKEMFSDATELYWENLKTGDQGKFPLDKLKEPRIQSFHVLSDGVMIDGGYREIYKVDFKGNFYKLAKEFYTGIYVLIETSKKIFIANSYGVWSTNKDLSGIKTICEYSPDDDITVTMLECVEDSVLLHVFKEGWNSYYYRYNITENQMQRLNEYPFLSGKFSGQIGFMATSEEIIGTKNYVAIKNAIYPRSGSSRPVWGKEDGLIFLNHAIGIYQGDIILGTVHKFGEKKQPEIAMFDLKKSKSPIFFPIIE